MVPLFIALGITVGVIILFFALYLGIAGMVLHRLMQPKKRADEFLIQHETQDKKFDSAWLDMSHEHKYLYSERGYKLHARLYLAKEKTDKFILLLHGHNSSSIGMLKYMPIFLDLGYNVFLPDHRFSGQSEGKSITFGCFEKLDVIQWMDYIAREYPTATFALLGESMGAATATLVAGLDPRVRFLIEYCGYANFEQLVLPYLKSHAVFSFIKPAFTFMSKAMYGVDLKEIDALSAMHSLKIPVLIMHSKQDKKVFVNNAYAFRDVCPNATVKLFENAAHARSWVKYPQEFTDTVKNFVRHIDGQ